MGGKVREITGEKSAKEAQAVASAQQSKLAREEEIAKENASQLAQEQSRKFRERQYRGIRSLVDTSETGSLG